MTERLCLNCKKRYAYPGDDFCSSLCAKAYNHTCGLIPEAELTTEDRKRIASRRAARARSKTKEPITFENEYVNRPRHEGPARRQHIRRVS